LLLLSEEAHNSNDNSGATVHVQFRVWQEQKKELVWTKQYIQSKRWMEEPHLLWLLCT
jgi:hypothetical protein